MSSTTARTGYAEPAGVGWVVFASILLFIAGIWNFIDGILAIGSSHVYVGGAHFVFSDLKTWGWIVMILGITQLAAGVGRRQRRQLGTVVRDRGRGSEQHRAVDVPAGVPVLGAGDVHRRHAHHLRARRVRRPETARGLAISLRRAPAEWVPAPASGNERSDLTDVPLACVLGFPARARAAALRARAFTDRAEPPLAARRGGDERRRVRRRLVRRAGDPGGLSQHRAGVERPEPARAVRARHVGARVRAHPCVDRLTGAADQLPSVPPWTAGCGCTTASSEGSTR